MEKINSAVRRRSRATFTTQNCVSKQQLLRTFHLPHRRNGIQNNDGKVDHPRTLPLIFFRINTGSNSSSSSSSSSSSTV